MKLLFWFIFLPMVAISSANAGHHYWQLKFDHYNEIYLQCGVYSYSNFKIIYHDVGKVDKMVISTHTDYVKSKEWMTDHIKMVGEVCD